MTDGRHRKIAREAYERVKASASADFTLAEVIDEIRSEIAAHDMEDDVVAEFSVALAQSEDKQQAKRDDRQLNLLDEASDDSVWRLGEGRRIVQRRAGLAQVLQWLSLREENAAHVLTALGRDKQDVARLLPYMKTPRTTVPQARAAYLADHPESSS